MDIVTEIYKQCHEHLKETDKKRDQLAALFAVVVGLVLANFDKCSESIQQVISFGVAMAGLLVLLTVMHYRKWHLLYVRCVEFLNIYSQVKDVDNAVKQYRKKYKSKWMAWVNPFASTEVSVFYFICIIAFIPFQLFVETFVETSDIVFVNTCFSSNTILFLFNFMVFIIAANLVAFAIMKKADKKEAFDIWLLHGITNANLKYEDNASCDSDVSDKEKT